MKLLLNTGAFNITATKEDNYTKIEYSTPVRDYNVYKIIGNWSITTADIDCIWVDKYIK